MKNLLLLFSGILLLAACSSPKYAYNFDHYDYNSGKKQTKVAQAQTTPSEEFPVTLNEETLTASTDDKIIASEKTSLPSMAELKAVKEKYQAMNKSEKKAFRKELKQEVKSMIKNKNKIDEGNVVKNTKVMDNDLRMALIFGIVGLVLSLFGGVNSVFWVLGVIAIVIAVVFLIMWLSRQ